MAWIGTGLERTRLMNVWMLAVTLCFLNMPNTAEPLCMPATIPLQWETQQKCEADKINFVNYFNPVAKERQLSMVFTCVSKPLGAMPLPQDLQENFYEGHSARSSERFSISKRKHI